MKGMKAAAPKEVGAIRKRTLRLFAMDRIEKPDCDYIIRRLDEIEARVEQMPERKGNR